VQHASDIRGVEAEQARDRVRYENDRKMRDMLAVEGLRALERRSGLQVSTLGEEALIAPEEQRE
jgi:hypothetical protein